MKETAKIYLNKEYLFGIPTDAKYLKYFLVFYISVIVCGIVVSIYFKKKNRSKIIRSFAKKFFWWNATLGLIGLFIVFSRNQGLPLFSTRIINYILIISIFLINLYLIFIDKHKFFAQFYKEKAKERKEKWIPGQKKKA